MKNTLSKTPSLVIVFMLLLGVFASASSPTGRFSTRVQPALTKLASTDPALTVGVIVQKIAGTSGAEQQAKRLGGRVVRDLSIINGFS